MTERKILFQFGYARHADQDAGEPVRHPVIIIGAGPVGMTLALDLERRGVKALVLDDADRIGEGSRAICFSKRTLEIFDRIGVAAPMLAKGVVWQKGKVFLRKDQIYEFDLLPEGGHKMPAFINLQQYYAEQYLVEAMGARGLEIRWRNKVVGIEQRSDHVEIVIETPDGRYTLSCDWLLACDGARSPARAMLGLDFAGEEFDDQFLIADVKMQGDFPTERWFWFEPPFHNGQSALLHRQPDDVWRIDLQLGREANVEDEVLPGKVTARIARMLGHDRFTLEWMSVYKFQCRRLARFRHDRVIFAGDSAHQVSPFGARGANSGIQDTENLAWKLAEVMGGISPEQLLDTYDIERGQAADENILNSTRATDFIAPRSAGERQLRDAALHLAAHSNFVRRFVNSGRLSLPTTYDSPLSMTAASDCPAISKSGAVAPDLPLPGASGGWLLSCLGHGFSILHIGVGRVPDASLIGVAHIAVPFDAEGLVARRYGDVVGAVYVVRPDQHVCARFDRYDPEMARAAIARAQGQRLPA